MISQNARYYPALDGVRGVAILAVMFCHFAGIFTSHSTPEYLVYRWLAEGGKGVDLFFVLSGFLITGILLDAAKDRGFFSTFYFRRALRILPLYFAYLFFTAVILRNYAIVTSHSDPYASAPTAWFVTFLGNWPPARSLFQPWSHLWSLCIEEQFYWIWPIVIFVIPRRYLGRTFLLLIAAVFYYRYRAIEAGVDVEFLKRCTLLRVDTFAIGGLVALAVRRPRWRKVGEMLWLPAGLVILVWITARETGALPELPFLHFFFSLSWVDTPLFCACLIFIAATAEHIRVLEFPFLKTMGKYSYGLYLLHPFSWWILPCGKFAASPFIVKASVLICLAGISFALARIAWVLIERPFLRLKSGFVARPRVVVAPNASLS
jgi:peptidoglycan/LPS O-acetylase OafA/YrhL